MSDDLDAIRARVAAATKGPWWVERPADKDAYLRDAYIACGTQGDGSDTYDVYERYNVDTDYEFMAHARMDIPALLARLDALTHAAEWYMREVTLRHATFDLDSHVGLNAALLAAARKETR